MTLPGMYKINIVLGLHALWLVVIYFTWPFIFFFRPYVFVYFFVTSLTLFLRTVLKGDCWLTNVENNLRRTYAPKTVYNDTDKCLPYYSGRWFGFRIEKPVIVGVFSFLFLLSLAVVIKASL